MTDPTSVTVTIKDPQRNKIEHPFHQALTISECAKVIGLSPDDANTLYFAYVNEGEVPTKDWQTVLPQGSILAFLRIPQASQGYAAFFKW